MFYFINRTKIRKSLEKYFFLDTKRFILQSETNLKGAFQMRKHKLAIMGYLKVISFIVLIGMAEPIASLLIR